MNNNKDYGSWTLPALKAELEKRNAKKTGKKAVLVQRLQDYDILFGDVINNPETTYHIQCPDPKLFRDINTDINLPTLSAEDLHTFCAISEKQDETHAVNMYQEYYLKTFRVAIDGSTHYIISICESEMRKNLTYNVTIKYEENTIIEAQCECAAGMGPHAQCKHVIAVLYGILDFVKNKNINVGSSCTSSLQTFHHPAKTYKGSPKLVNHLKLKEHDENLKQIPVFEPRLRPCTSDEKYVEYFKNSCVNFCALQKKSMPISQIIKPADKKALYKDHDYMELTQEEKFLEDLKLTEEEIKKIEEGTRNNNNKWKKERLRRLHISNFGKICKSKDKTKIAKSLLKNIEILTPAIKHGLKYEKKAIQIFQNKTGLEVNRSGINIHLEINYLASTPDGLVGQDATIEIKCPYSAAHERISPETVNYIQLCEKSGEFQLKGSHDYFYQVQGQLLCTQRKFCYFCIYTFQDFHIMKIQRDDDFIETMSRKLNVFYEHNYKGMFLNRYLYNIKF